MTTSIRPTTILGAALLTMAALAPLAAQSKGLQVGDTAPTVVIQTLDGADYDLANIIGKKPALVEFWATWCPLCREMEPTIQALHGEHGDKLAIVRITVPQNQTPARALTYVTNRKLPGLTLFDTDGKAYKAFAAFHTSYIVILDAKGVVLHSADGGTQDLKAAVARAVR